jgi:hypothetical protein
LSFVDIIKLKDLFELKMFHAEGTKKKDKSSDELKLIFNGGSSTQFMQARPALVRAFIIEGAWVYVNYHPALGLGPCELPALGAAIVEDTFTDPKPLMTDVIVAGILQGRIDDRNELAQFQLDQLVALPLAAMNAHARLIRTMDIRNAQATDVLKIEESRQQVQKDLLTMLQRWESMSKDHAKKQAGALRVYTKCLGPEPLAHISDEIDAGHIRAAWIKLNRRYNVTVGGHANVQGILQQLNEAYFNPAGDSIIEHIHDMKMMALQTREAGVGAGIEDAMLLQFILRSVEKSRDKDFLADVEFINRHIPPLTLAEAEGVFQRTQSRKDAQEMLAHASRKLGKKDKRAHLAEVQAAISLLEKEKTNKKKKTGAAAPATPDPKKWLTREEKDALYCPKCKGYGHFERNCFSDKTCRECKAVGHIEKFCPKLTGKPVPVAKKVIVADLWKGKK